MRMRATTTVMAMAAGLLAPLAALDVATAPPAVAEPIEGYVEVEVEIALVKALENPEPAPGQGPADFYPVVRIDDGAPQGGASLETQAEIQDNGVHLLEPDDWVFTAAVPRAAGTVDVDVEIWDADTFNAAPDDVLDLNEQDEVTTAQARVRLEDGWWSWAGDDQFSNGARRSTGDSDLEWFGPTAGGEKGQIELSIRTIGGEEDTDGDGLLDRWEVFGADRDGDGEVDVTLPGADPMRKDLFVELDRMQGLRLSKAEYDAVVESFAVAPIANPDGTSGITLHIDTGGAVDPGADEGGGPGTCSNGFDDDLDGLVDGADNACLVGLDLGGGNPIGPAVMVPGGVADPAFEDLREANFDPGREKMFRWALFAPAGFEDGDPDPNSCYDGADNGTDGSIDVLDDDCYADTAGGNAFIGGPDFYVANNRGDTFMHELGHTLGLRHGGDDPHNCKVNHLSIMNYRHTLGIRVGGTDKLYDFAPARYPGSTARAGVALAPVDESDLDEGTPIDPADGVHQVAYVDQAGTLVRKPASAPLDYNGDGDTTDTGLAVNLDTVSALGFDKSCENDEADDVHEAHDDWASILLPVGDEVDVLALAIEPDVKALYADERLLNTADLSVELSVPGEAVAGATFGATVVVSAGGPNPASAPVVDVVLPAGVGLAGDHRDCGPDRDGIRCTVRELWPGEQAAVDVILSVSPEWFDPKPGEEVPESLELMARADNLVGPDPEPANDGAAAKIVVLERVDAVAAQVGADLPDLLVVGDQVEVEFDAVLGSAGPSGPAPVAGRVTVASASGLKVELTSPDIDAGELEPGETVAGLAHGTARCLTSGPGEIDLRLEVGTSAPDPEPGNDIVSGRASTACAAAAASTVPMAAFGQVDLALLTTGKWERGLAEPIDAEDVVVESVVVGTQAQVLAGKGTTRPSKVWLDDAREGRVRDGDADLMVRVKRSVKERLCIRALRVDGTAVVACP